MLRPLRRYHVERRVRPITTTTLTLLLLAGAAAPPAASPADGLSPAVVVTPDTAERRYRACLAGATTTPDTRAVWAVACRAWVASGRS